MGQEKMIGKLMGDLLGHAYTRYLADLMGGSVLGTPTRLALGLSRGSPQQYYFDFTFDGQVLSRKAYVEQIYRDLNASGNILAGNGGRDDNVTLEKIVDEARSAFKHNIEVYSEEPIYLQSFMGLKNIVTGYLLRR